ncbi:hypothetical protein LTS18_011878 [Coniosporium uncinatum]|uniref:Uncharacterized protein n=1 Tax=Coniosporium uncinatum TaxID=93489 RepID=A0ACC3DDA7_9PEZI|nr:hypothetical protein LTS18_011878 [Coniosporium uncinatum]
MPARAVPTQLFLTETSTSLEADVSTTSDIQRTLSTTQADAKGTPPSPAISTAFLSVPSNAVSSGPRASLSSQAGSMSSTDDISLVSMVSLQPDFSVSASGSKPAEIIASLLSDETQSQSSPARTYTVIPQLSLGDTARNTAAMTAEGSTGLSQTISTSTQTKATASDEALSVPTQSATYSVITTLILQSDQTKPGGSGASAAKPTNEAGRPVPSAVFSPSSSALPAEPENSAERIPTSNAPFVAVVTIGSSTAASEAASTQSAAVFILGNSTTVTARSGSPVTIGSYTLSIGGGAATVGNDIISAVPDGIVVSNTASTSTATFTSAPSIGGAINSGPQEGSSPGISDGGRFNTSSTSIEAATETASRASLSSDCWSGLAWILFALVWGISLELQ